MDLGLVIKLVVKTGIMKTIGMEIIVPVVTREPAHFGMPLLAVMEEQDG